LKDELKKENVLIIDDFDRLDPDHIFRILNILSVHQDYKSGDDKFGFDKIIVVCSLENIEAIYKHKYGSEVDFDGYIEKFYSTEVFHFNNRFAIAHYCRNNFSRELNDSTLEVLGVFLAHFVTNRVLSIRKIIKHDRLSATHQFTFGKFNFPESFQNAIKIEDMTRPADTQAVWANNYKYPIEKGLLSYFVDSADFPILKLVQILSTIFGDFNKLKEVLNKNGNSRVEFSLDSTKLIMNAFIPLIHFIYSNKNTNTMTSSQSNEEYYDSYHRGSYRILTLSNPRVTFISPEFDLPIGWGEAKQYGEHDSFYSLTKQGFNENFNYDLYHES